MGRFLDVLTRRRKPRANDPPTSVFVGATRNDVGDDTPAGKTWTYRIQGVPFKWNESDLQQFLVNYGKAPAASFKVKSLAAHVVGEYRTATVDCLKGVKLSRSVIGKLAASADTMVHLACDSDFHGLTTLFCPSEEDHLVDIVAVCGLGGHAFGSFKNKDDGYMWLRDGLGEDLVAEDSKQPMARIMTYGYDSKVSGSNCSQHVGDLAGALRESLSLLEARKPLVIIGHSLGGLIVKEAIITLSNSTLRHHEKLLQSVYGILFFGVPNDGMDITSLIPMVAEGPNIGMLTDISHISSLVLEIQRREFGPALTKEHSEVFCFYETVKSPTAKKVNGVWAMSGEDAFLVTKTSATHCRSWEDGAEHVCPINAGHSDLVKFERHNDGVVRGKIKDICRRAATATDRSLDPNVKFIVPYLSNHDFVGRTRTMEDVKAYLELEKPPFQRKRRRLSIYGLGGIGKTQIAISLAYWVKANFRNTSVLWVHASSMDRFRQSYSKIAEKYDVPNRNDPRRDMLALVRDFLVRENLKPWIMIIDNADDNELFFPSKVDDMGFAINERVDKYLPNCNHGSILMTTRDKRVGISLMYGREPLEVTKLSGDEAWKLINQTLGHDHTSEEKALALSARLEHLPLAIAQALAYIVKNTITIDQYIHDLGDSDERLVKQLSQPFQAAGRDTETPNAVTAAWVMSLRQIKTSDRLADDLMSLMSMFDQQAIREDFIASYMNARREEASGSRADETSITESLGTLKAYSFITLTADGTYDMHRLVQLVTRKWLLRESRMDEFAALAVEVVGEACPYPYVEYETLDEMMRLLPHARAVLGHPMHRNCTDETKRKKGTILKQMGRYCVWKSQFADAEVHAEKAHQLLKDTFGAEDQGTLLTVELLLDVYKSQGRYEEGTTLGEEEKRRSEQALGKEHDVTLRITKALGSLHFRQGNVEEAEEMLLFVCDAYKKKHGDEHHETLSSMNSLALVYNEQKRLDEALELQRKLVETRIKLKGKEHPQTLVNQHNLAAILGQRRDFKEAGRIHAEVAEATERILGPEHASTLASLHALSLNHAEQGNFKQAEELASHVWRLKMKTVGQHHPETLTAMHNYTCCLHWLGRTVEAIELMRNCWSHGKQYFGEDHAITLISEAFLQDWESEVVSDGDTEASSAST